MALILKCVTTEASWRVIASRGRDGGWSWADAGSELEGRIAITSLSRESAELLLVVDGRILERSGPGISSGPMSADLVVDNSSKTLD